MTTLSIVNAIIQVGNVIASANSGSSASSNRDSLQKTMDALRDLLIPEDKEEKESVAARVKGILEREMNQGMLKVTAKGKTGAAKGRIKRRGNIDGGSES